MFYKVFFGHPKSVGVEVDATTEKEAKIAAMEILKENRGDRKWSPRQCVDWEKGKSTQTPPRSPFFGEFPPVVRVDVVG